MSTRYHLDSSFSVIGTANAGAGILDSFQTTHSTSFVIGDHWQPGKRGLLLRRSTLADEVVRIAFGGEAEREQWRTLLEAQPEMFGSLIAFNVLKLAPDGPYGSTSSRLSQNVRRRTQEYLDYYVNSRSRRKQLEVPIVSVARGWPPTQAIAVRGDEVVGVIVPQSYRGVAEGRPPASGTASLRPDTGSEVRATRRAVKAAPIPFIAHPRLDVEGPALPGQELPFKVGFSDRPDPEADQQQRINIPEPAPGEFIVVVASAVGAQIVEPSMVKLRLDFAESHEFKAVVSEGVTQVELRACYIYQGKPVGHIVKAVKAGDVHPFASGEKIKHVSVVGLPRPTTNHEEIAGLDVILYVHKKGDSELTWQAYVPATGDVHGTYYVQVKDTTEFAKQLAGLRSLGDQSPSAREELFVTGQQIAALIPVQIIEQVLAPALKQNEAPAILIYTDEPYIPWELARPEPRRLGRSSPASLGALARIGRWWSGASLPGPRSCRTIQHVSAVAAVKFAGGYATTLRHAVEERAWLKQEFNSFTTEVEAIQPDIDAWLDQPRRPSHLGHIALHGYSDALSNTQGLILADGSPLTPNRLAGQYYEGQIPRFEMVFLNACQVGTAGERLGRMSGFPGALLLGGASGFIGPLWEVEDEIALACAQTFYESVLRKKIEVGEALRKLREAPPNEKSITPWAYLFYGHPKLQLLL